MTRKQQQRRREFIKGYRRGYQKRGLTSSALSEKNEDFRRGYLEGRKDYADGEPAIY